MYNNSFYQNLIKPDFMPPSAVFAPVWGILYFLMFFSLVLIFTSDNDKYKGTALMLFGVQLVLNLLWSPVFFLLEMPTLALVICILLLIAVAFMLYRFWQISKIAALLNVPYFLWLIFATVLNFEIVRLNIL